MSFWNSFAEDSVKDDSSKAKFFESIQVYLKDFVRVVIHQGEWLAQDFLNT